VVTTPNHGLTGVLRRIVAGVLVALIANLPATLAVHAEEGRANAVVSGGALSVASNPVGADVFIDGRFAGRTPLSVASVVPGDHRVRVVKDGYLENSRLVNVSVGQPRALDVKLTKTSADNAAAAQVTGGGGGGGGSKKWLWIGIAGAAGGGALAYTMLNSNKPPTAGAATVTPTGTGLAGFTSYSFTSTGRDPDNDPLTVTWNFGDNATGTGATATHVYAAAGTYSVSYSVSDGKKSAASPGLTVVVGRSMAGVWTGGVEPGFNDPFSINLTQNAAALGGSTTFSSGLSGSGLTGTIAGTTYPVTVTYTQAYNISIGTVTDTFSGTTDATGATLTGTMTVTLPVGFVFTATNSRTATGPVTLRR
jgi:hypothetical protein